MFGATISRTNNSNREINNNNREISNNNREISNNNNREITNNNNTPPIAMPNNSDLLTKPQEILRNKIHEKN